LSHDINFLALLKAENGELTHDRMHPTAYMCKGRTSHDWGLCGISDCYFPEIVNNPKFLDDLDWQLEQCKKLYDNGTTFYGNIKWGKKHFIYD